MKANASKFQAICLSRENVSIDFEIDNHVIQSDSVVKQKQQSKLMFSKDYVNKLITQVNLKKYMNNLSHLFLSTVHLYMILSQ